MKKIIAATFMMVLILLTTFSVVSGNILNEIYMEPTSYNTIEKTNVEKWAVIVGAAGDIYCHNDAIDLNNTLVNNGWRADHIKVLTNPALWYIKATKENIINAIRWLESKEDEDDIVLFFFGCHGQYRKIFDCYGEAITCEELNNEFNNFETENIVIIFNSCFSGSMVSIGSTVSVQEELIGGLNENNNVIGFDESVEFIPTLITDNENISVENDLEFSGSNGLDKPGRVILMSSGRFEISWSSYILENGIFSYFLIKGFEGKANDLNQDGWISAEEAFKYAKPRTKLFTGLRPQHPQIYDGYEGEFNIVPDCN